MSSIISKESKKLKESRKSIRLLETIVEHTTSRTSSIFLFSPFTWQSTYQFYISTLLVYSFYLSYSSNRILDERREEKKKSEERGRRRDLISEQQSPLCLASPRLYLAGALFARYSAASRSSKHANRFQGWGKRNGRDGEIGRRKNVNRGRKGRILAAKEYLFRASSRDFITL